MLRTLGAVVLATVVVIALSSETFALGDGRRHRSAATNGGDQGSYTTNTTTTTVVLDEKGNGHGPLTSAPEPGTLVLLASGAVGVVSWIRRRM